MRALAEALYYELKQYSITVTMVCPGFVKSDIRARNRFGEVKENVRDYAGRLAMDTDKAAAIIYKAIAKGRREKIVTWHGYFAIHLKRFFPGIVSLVFKLQKRRVKD